jgi:hypothetical protein
MDNWVVNRGFYDFHSCPQVTFAPLFKDLMPEGCVRCRRF